VRTTFLSATLVALIGCQAGNPGGTEDEELLGRGNGVQSESLPEGTSLDEIFGHAGALHDVPPALLKAIAWSETRGMMVRGEVEHEGLEPAFGIMALRGATLEEGAALAELDVELVKTDLAANVFAAAALLSKIGDELDVVRSDLASWAPAVAAMSGIELEAGQVGWVRDEVYGVLRHGVIAEGLTLEPEDVTLDMVPYAATPGPDYAASVWRASPNFSSRPSGSSGVPQMVIIHSCEGSYSGCWSWLASSQSGVSAHYVVNSTGTEISQLVRESKKAWHISANYDCSKNSSVACGLNGKGSNNFTIGIEHAGFANQSSWDDGLLDASAALVCDITEDNAIPRDGFHIVAHGQLQPWNRIDPGPNWPWGEYLGLVSSHCNEGPPPEPPPDETEDAATILVDSNQGANGENAKIEVSSSWTASTGTPGYYNTGYWYRSTGSTSDLARFKAYIAAPKKMKVEAWWPAASNRSPNAPFLVFDAGENHIDTVYVNQQQNGSQWVELGTYDLPAGWNTVGLSRWTGSGYIVVADAVRFTEVP
jgi:N-acetyl-anhydromuramyl-L-alanine amidase AmpD